MRSFPLVIFFLLMSVVFAAPCSGGTLVIACRSTLSISADRMRVDVFAENIGNETAYQVQAYLYIFNRQYSADAVDQLGVKQNRTFQFGVLLPSGKKGEFPFVGEVRYYDVNRRPVTVLSAGTFKLGSFGGGLLSGRAPELTLTANETLAVKIRSGDPAPRDVVATLYLPPSLTTPQKQKPIRLKPFEAATVNFPLTHPRGTGDATYPVYCTLTYHDAGVAHAAVVQSVVHVKDFQSRFVRTRWYWLGAGVLIVLGWVWIWVGGQGPGVGKKG